jgi:hypothetical protein
MFSPQRCTSGLMLSMGLVAAQPGCTGRVHWWLTELTVNADQALELEDWARTGDGELALRLEAVHSTGETSSAEARMVDIVDEGLTLLDPLTMQWETTEGEGYAPVDFTLRFDLVGLEPADTGASTFETIEVQGGSINTRLWGDWLVELDWDGPKNALEEK